MAGVSRIVQLIVRRSKRGVDQLLAGNIVIHGVLVEPVRHEHLDAGVRSRHAQRRRLPAGARTTAGIGCRASSFAGAAGSTRHMTRALP